MLDAIEQLVVPRVVFEDEELELPDDTGGSTNSDQRTADSDQQSEDSWHA